MFSEVQKGEIRKRFHLHDGAFYGWQKFRNLWWYLNDQEFGYGDLRESDIQRIHEALEPGEVFKGFNEHHMSRFMQRETPMVEINCVEVKFPEFKAVSTETWQKIKEKY